MKFSLKNTMINTKKSIKRFPITIFLSAVLTILLIVLTEKIAQLTPNEIEGLNRINMAVALGVLLSLNIKLFAEIFIHKKTREYVLYFIGAIGVYAYFSLLLADLTFVSTTRYAGLVLALILAFFFIPHLSKKEGYENHVTQIFSSLLITAVYSGVLIFGLFAILFTIDQLFDLNIDSKYYYYIFIIVSLIFSVALFLSKIPSKDEDLEKHQYSKSLRVLLLYIVIPLVSIYTLILYIYFVKILVTSNWPKGLVSHLVLWYSAISVGVLFLITPLTEDYSVGRIFKSFFPKINIPLLLMMFVSIGIRINQYGITENRYYVCLLGFWILGIMVYYSIIKKSQNIIIPITLMITFIVAIFGPLSSYSFSIRSQNGRFNEILTENNMIIDGSIQKNPNIDQNDKENLSSILSYFESYHSFGDLQGLPSGFNLSKMEDVFGFGYTYHDPYEEDYFYMYTDLYGKTLDISGYNYYLPLNNWVHPVVDVEGFTVTYENQILQIKSGDQLIFEKNMMDYIELILQNSGESTDGSKEIDTDIHDISFEEKTDALNLKLIITSISARRHPNLQLENMEFVLLINTK